MATYVLLNEYIPEIKFKGKLLNSDVVTVGETATFDASDSNFCSDYAGIIHGFYNFPKNHAEGVTGYPKYFFDKRDNENKDCSAHAVEPDPSNVSYVTLSGYDPLASDEDNLPYVALRVANGDFMLPNATEPVDCIYPSEIVFDYKVESFGDQDIQSICALADFFCTQRMSDDTYANTMMVAKRDNGKTVITTDSYLPPTGDYTSPSLYQASTHELDIDWSQWHRIRITYDYTKAFINTDGETIQGRNCTYFRLYIDDVFIPFIYTGLPGEWCDSNGVLEDGSLYPSSAASNNPYYNYCGFASYVSQNAENSAVLYKNFRINRYVGQGNTLNADWYKWRPYDSPNWLYLDTGLTINHEIEAGDYPNAETNAYRTTVYNQWGSSQTIDFTEQCIVPPTVGMNYVLQSTGTPVTVNADTQVELNSTDIVTLNAVTTSGMTHINAFTFYPWENDATTHSGDSFTNLGDLNNPNYQSMIDYSDGWLQLNGYTGSGPDARFGSNYYDFETLEGFFKITTEDVNAMLQETGSDNAFYIPLIMFGGFEQYSNDRCYVCYNPKVNLDDTKSIATFGKKTEGTFSICRFDGSDFKQCYFTFPKLEDTDIYHIALCYRVNDKKMCFVFINGICVFSAKFDDKVLDDYTYQKAVLSTNSGGANWIPVTLAMRSIRESLVKVYDVNFDMQGCFTFEDYPNGYAVSDDYYAFVGNQLAQRKYFDPAVLYPDNKLTYQVLNPGVNNSWWLTLPDEEEQKISDSDTAVVTVNRNCIYTLKSQDSAGGQTVNLNLDFILHVPPTAVITTDSLSVYKGQYVVLSGENSFDEITSYQWSDGSTGSQTGFFAEQDTTVSLIVTNPYGSDTAVVTIKVVELPVIEDVAGEYRIITVQQIPVDPVPYQEFAVILNGQNCFITLRQMGDFIYMSLRVDNTVIYNNLICDVNRVINIYPDANFAGKFFFIDTKGKVKPEYSGLNSRWLLYYSEDY